MISILLTIVAVVLLATLLVAGINYIPSTAYAERETKTLAQTGFSVLSNAFSAYRIAKGAAPAVTTWDTDLTPRYGLMPKPPKNMTWTYGENGTGGYWFCLSGTVGKVQYEGLANLQTLLQDQVYFISDTCGATANGSLPSSYPASVAATYWVVAP